VNFAPDKRPLQILCLAGGLSAFGVAVFYMAQWLQMPLYPDEVALRVWKARWLADGNMEYSLLPQCPSNAKAIPLIFRPVAYAFSIFDFYLNWSLLRAMPLAAVALALGASMAIICGRRAPAALLITAAGFIGVAGSGLVLFRMEIPLIFYGAACVAGYALVRRDQVRPAIVAAYFAVSTLLALFAFFVHLQSLILAPFGILLAAGFLIRRRSGSVKIFAGVSAVCIAMGALAIATTGTIKCPEQPSVERAFGIMTLPGLAKYEGLSSVQQYLTGKIDSYRDQFLFKPKYDVNYLPGTAPDSSGGNTSYGILNSAISFAVLLNLLTACGVLLYAGILTARVLISGRLSLSDKLNLATTAPCVYLFVATAGHLGLFVVDVPTNFYRAAYIHFALVLTNAMALTGLKGIARVGLWPVGIFSVFLCIVSGVVVRDEIKPKLVAGWSGPSISLNTNWSAVRLDVVKLAAKCGIPAKESRLLIDDVTFDAMRQHSHLMPVTYIGMAYNPNAPGAKQPGEFIRSLGATYVLARCLYFGPYQIRADVSSDELCCAKL
jgi:hypothetical protein